MKRITAVAFQNADVEDCDAYLDLLQRHGFEIDLIRVDQGERIPDRIEADLLIVGGTPVSALEFAQDGRLQEEYSIVRASIAEGVPTLGICCGAQILALMLGGSVSRMPEMEIGCVEVELTADGKADPLFLDFPERFAAFQWHADVFGPPPGGKVLVSSQRWPYQVFRHNNVIGVLFHLEIDSYRAFQWTAAYPDDLQATNVEATDIVDMLKRQEQQMNDLAGVLMRNLARIVRSGL